MSIKIIAEAGVNHNGQEALAIQLIDAAHQAGANVVKFQTFKAKSLVTATAQQAEYQVQNSGKTESQLAMLSRLELSFESHHRLLAHCKQLNIEFLSTAFDNESLDFLVNELKLKTLKIPSGELTNAPLLLKHAQTQCQLIVSTGMATLAEIENALAVIAFGLTAPKRSQPSQDAFQEALFSPQGQAALQDKVTLLHCTTEYPAPIDEINLNAMRSMSQTFGLPTGYSDHSEGLVVPVAAASLGACLIEKHFTLDKNMEGPDHKASLEPNELAEMVQQIRMVESALGNGIKGPTASEVKNKAIARKSLVAAKSIQAGETITAQHLAIKRPGTGSSPFNYWSLLGSTAQHSYNIGDPIID